MGWSGQAAQHDADHGEAEEGRDGSGVTLEVAGQAAVAADPGKSTLDDPSLGQDDEAMGIAALDDLQAPEAGFGDHVGHLRSLVASIGKDAFDKRKGSPRRAQQVARAVPAYQARIVSYADDFVIVSRKSAAEALAWTRQVMIKLGLTLNEAKTAVRDSRRESFDFLGYPAHHG
jgi:hypothetical protein